MSKNNITPRRNKREHMTIGETTISSCIDLVNNMDNHPHLAQAIIYLAMARECVADYADDKPVPLSYLNEDPAMYKAELDDEPDDSPFLDNQVTQLVKCRATITMLLEALEMMVEFDEAEMLGDMDFSIIQDAIDKAKTNTST